jgi:predicted site-specific integrase-resolvase
MYTRVEPEVLSVAECAIEVRRSAATVRRWIRDGQLAAVRLPSGGLVVPVSELASFERIERSPRAGRERTNRRNTRRAVQ